MSDAGWAALAIIVTQVLLFIVTIVKLWLGDRKVEKVEKKVDDNTKVTLAGANAATTNARVAAKCAVQASEKVDAIDKKLNGGVDSAVKEGMEPINSKLDEHDKSIKEITEQLIKLTKYVHESNHTILDKMSAQSNKVELILQNQKKT